MSTGRGLEDRASEQESPRIAQRRLQGQMSRVLAYGTVAEIKGRQVRVDVGGNTTDWIGWAVPRGGKDGEESEWNPPFIGEQVMLGCPNGDFNQATILCSIETPGNERPLPGDDPKLGVRKRRDGGVETFDMENHARTLTMPEDGSYKVVVGNASFEIKNGQIELMVGGKGLKITEEEIVTIGKTRLNNGNRPVVYQGSTDTHGDTNNQGEGEVLV